MLPFRVQRLVDLCNLIYFVIFTAEAQRAQRRDAFSFAVERTTKEKNQSLRDIFESLIPEGHVSYCFLSSQRKTITKKTSGSSATLMIPADVGGMGGELWYQYK